MAALSNFEGDESLFYGEYAKDFGDTDLQVEKYIVADDPRMNYIFIKPENIETQKPKPPEVIARDLFDYGVVIKKGEELAFSNKAKIVNVNIPLKVADYIQQNLKKELAHFKNKYKLDLNIIPNNNLIIPDYSIELLNKNKKVINKIDSIEKIEKILINKNNKKNFINKKNNKNFKTGNKFKKKFKYYPKAKK